MPHFSIEYSANLEAQIDIPALLEVLRSAAIETGLFPTAGIRIRAFRADHVSLADGNPQHAFLDLLIRLREGRPQAAKEAATAHIFKALEGFLAPSMVTHSIALSMEMRDIDARLSPKAGSIRAHLQKDS
jgi:5-carboxymethyl-2-hydroxymuconate isomerase